jgi:N-acyl-D-aspartate/D-glutamate deacylase
LVFSHARLASQKELEILIKETARHKKVYATHLRNEASELSTAIEESITIARRTGVSLHIFHLKALGEKNWPLMKQVLQKISQAKKEGVDISFSIYPYQSTGSVLYTFLPEWVARGGRRMLLKRLQDKKYRQRLIAEMKEDGIDYSKMIISISSLDKTLTSKKIKDIAKSQNKSVEEAVVDILIVNNGRVIVLAEAISRENIILAIKHPDSIIASAGVGYSEKYQESGRIIHPRSFGAFPKVLQKYVLQEKIISWEKAIAKMTALPAKKFGIKKRGQIKINNFADVLIIDPKTIASPATIDSPYQYAKGIDFVLVNGKFVVKSGRYTGKKAGQIVK